MDKKDIVRMHVWTERFLGTRAKGSSLLALIDSIDSGRWVPDKWGDFEPARTPYGPQSREAILTALTEERGGCVSNLLVFTKKRPRSEIAVNTWRAERVNGLNHVRIDLDATALETEDVTDRLAKLMLDFVSWSDGVYATARHTKQFHWRLAQMTPRERLERMDWLTFFGEPYIELFGGRRRVERAPCHLIRSVPKGLLLIAAPGPKSPEVTQGDELLLSLEEYLGAEVFAGRGYPQIPCRVPRFDLSETVVAPSERLP